MFVFYTVFILLIAQRLLELRVAKRNQAWMEGRGGVEIGKEHYMWIVMLHIGFFLSLWIETATRGYPVLDWWPFIACVLLIVQFIRYWAITSLGPYWNTRIIFVPGAHVVKRGPYRFMRHPNYMAVILELALIPLLFEAYVTLGLFSMLNAWMLLYRIRVEECGLAKYTDYASVMSDCSRFIPKNPEEK
ncbi:isoprenylcysteine carboxyl methyltransferase family protein [Aneurinibacillus aneurinilyticus]|uniref:Isoprenylcysteine carboxyl methyltransferase family protein n=1 Tax=Aneurinibacillus aneurinilyticus ATCC 12856 TaxID=649747 RepID=U1YGE2_ANEAE|nr:isoprenylcysteine carboxylmethyltransferase family protein [Aneurinibacillus aneurinilyticus]ERI09841.1 isoprenylcysteine carboxyl methyltransferase family protein [Aneurinibacillus aneurinilyticus ATCC 12856]MED0708004.1 isoprenylcysteine carboxylmethyltransferase family protein [Aneurinibacillus aneurinilyticus]MED0722167.1 isoprenylcysteine carboxylmethyltransferase family protein [Aneurinibacillus aneurinilyticus]MED0734327.1 isoprenylcysteine carboxylmethyltransferase family protein [An